MLDRSVPKKGKEGKGGLKSTFLKNSLFNAKFLPPLSLATMSRLIVLLMLMSALHRSVAYILPSSRIVATHTGGSRVSAKSIFRRTTRASTRTRRKVLLTATTNANIYDLSAPTSRNILGYGNPLYSTLSSSLSASSSASTKHARKRLKLSEKQQRFNPSRGFRALYKRIRKTVRGATGLR